MKASALQEFLRSLGGSLSVVGVQQKSLEDLRAVAHALEPFADLSLEQLADLLKRAADFRRNGELPAVSVPGLDEAMTTAHELGEAVQSVDGADATKVAELETKITRGKQTLQSAIGRVVGEFGIDTKFTDDKKWLPNLLMKGEVSRVADKLRRIAPQITDSNSYRSETVQSAVTELIGTDEKILKAAASSLSVSGSGKGRNLVESILVKLTGVDNKPPKASKLAKEPAASDGQVDAVTKTLQDMAERATDPHAVSDSEIDGILNKLKTEFSEKQLKGISQNVTGEKAKGKGKAAVEDALHRLRSHITRVKRLLASQDS